MIRDIDTAACVPREDARNINAAKVEALAESISDTGLINPIRVRPIDGDRFEVIAGMHRLQAHKILGLAEITAIVVNDDDLHAELAMIDENLIREELTPVDRAQSVARRKEIYEELFPDTVAGVAGGKARQGTATDKLSFAADTARATGRDERSVQRDAARGARIAPDVMDFIRATPLNTGLFLDRIKNLAPAEQMRVSREELRRVEAAERARRAAKAAGKKQRREQRETELAAKIAALPDKRYGVIYADPEWRFEPYSRETGMDRAADNHYPTSTLVELMRRDVRSIAADDSVLFLWATVPMLIEAICVMDAWGFALINRDPETGFLMPDKRDGRYVSHVGWRKADIESRGENPEKVDRGRYSTGLVLGTGYWFRNAHELLLVGVRGNVPAPAMGNQFPSMIDAAPLRHSQKPERFHELIEAYFPALPKIELNARARRDGWDAWGFEAPDDAASDDDDMAEAEGVLPKAAVPPPASTYAELLAAYAPEYDAAGKFVWTDAADALLAAGKRATPPVSQKQLSDDLGCAFGSVASHATRLGLTVAERAGARTDLQSKSEPAKEG